MASILFKWFLFAGLLFAHPAGQIKKHPFFVSVTEIGYNATEKTLEISCKIFTDDFEKALRQQQTAKIDLTDKQQNTDMGKFVDAYLQKHLAVKVNKKALSLHFLGFEQVEGAVISYYEAAQTDAVKIIEVNNSVLYDYQTQQMNIVHITVNGKRQSKKLGYPDEKLVMEF